MQPEELPDIDDHPHIGVHVLLREFRHEPVVLLDGQTGLRSILLPPGGLGGPDDPHLMDTHPIQQSGGIHHRIGVPAVDLDLRLHRETVPDAQFDRP